MYVETLAKGSVVVPKLLSTALCVFLMAVPLVATADPTPAGPLEAMSGPMGEELRRIQEELGGSAVEGFSGLRSAKPRAARGAADLMMEGLRLKQAISALRDGAAQLDVTANRLEGFGLYAQADALRKQAQRLRLDARGMMKSAATTPMGTMMGEQDSPGASPTSPRVLEPENPQNRALQPEEPARSPQ